MGKVGQVQLGKNGVTDNFIQTLKNHFEKYWDVKISVLQNARDQGAEGRKQVRKYSEEILKGLGKNFTAKIIGHTIAVKKWRKEVRG